MRGGQDYLIVCSFGQSRGGFESREREMSNWTEATEAKWAVLATFRLVGWGVCGGLGGGRQGDRVTGQNRGPLSGG